MSTTEIVYGLGGLLAGSILTGLVQALSRWHERRLAKRAAARAVFSDLLGSKQGLNQAINRKSWEELPSDRREDWILYRDALSNGMSWEDFHSVAAAFHDLWILNRMRERGDEFDPDRCEEAVERFLVAEPLVKEEGMTWLDRLRNKKTETRIALDDLP